MESSWRNIEAIPELLGLVFVHCLPFGWPGPGSEKWAAPETLVRVCRLWRKVALSTPSLWSNIHLRSNSGFGSAILLRLFHKAKAYQERSMNAPLSIDVDTSNLPYNLSSGQLVNVNDLHCTLLSSSLFSSFQRWRHVILRTPLQTLLPTFAYLQGSNTSPNLETLLLDFSSTPSVEFLDSPQRRDELRLPIALNKATNLESLMIYGNWDDRVILEWDPSKAPKSLQTILLWNIHLDVKHTPASQGRGDVLSNVRKICISSYLSSTDLIFLLQSAPMLEDLTLDVSLDFVRPGSLSTSHHTVPHRRGLLKMEYLTNLRLHLTPTLCNILFSTSRNAPSFAFPALEQLELAFGHSLVSAGADFRVLPQIIYLLARSDYPPVTSCMLFDDVGLFSSRSDEQDLIAFMHCLRKTEELRIITPGAGNAFGRHLMKALTVSTDTSTRGSELVCPQLTSLTLSPGFMSPGRGENSLPGSSLVKMILSRIAALNGNGGSGDTRRCAPLRLVQVKVDDEASVRSEPAIVELIERNDLELVLT